MNRSLSVLVCLLALVGCLAAHGCTRSTSGSKAPSTEPTLRLYVLSTIAGAMEPCGCRKDMLGGVDHAAAMIEASKKQAPQSLIVGAGPMLFMDPAENPQSSVQDQWKAESIADAFKLLGVAAWAPGANDFAHGAKTLEQLRQRSGATLVAANAKSEIVPIHATRIVTVGGKKVGLTGVSVFDEKIAETGKVRLEQAQTALQAAQAELRASGAEVLVGLITAPRGQALRLAESVSGFHVIVLGKPQDEGHANDSPTDAVQIGETLIVQAPNHLQAVAVVDLFVRDGSLHFRDGSGLDAKARTASLQQRIKELEQRLEGWQADSNVRPEDLAARQADLEKMRIELKAASQPPPPPKGSFFRYELREIREGLGTSATIEREIANYYARVNTRNKELFADRKPPPVPAGGRSFVGGAACAECHQEAMDFWKKTGHAGAYETLTKDHKEFNLDCVSCHVTGYEQPGGSTVTFVAGLQDVQCEECHGAGSAHVVDENEQTITLKPPESLCSKCHHPPHVVDDWSAKEAWKHIVGPGHGAPLEPGAPAK